MGCTGNCCAAFSLDEDVQLEIMNGQEADDQTIRVMLIPLGDGNFTCRHWNPETKLCGIYATRPAMCRTFPEKGNPCGQEGCDL